MIAVCNPNNPTGRILTDSEMDTIVAAADRVGAWLLSDEVYAGAECLTDRETPSFWGRYDKVLIQQSLSKAYGLPGLRTGWIVTQPELRNRLVETARVHGHLPSLFVRPPGSDCPLTGKADRNPKAHTRLHPARLPRSAGVIGQIVRL